MLQGDACQLASWLNRGGDGVPTFTLYTQRRESQERDERCDELADVHRWREDLLAFVMHFGNVY